MTFETAPIQVGQIWARRKDGRRVKVVAITPTNIVALHHLGRGLTTHPMACTLRTDYQLVHQPEEIQL
jgi:hypothetical protein